MSVNVSIGLCYVVCGEDEENGNNLLKQVLLFSCFFLLSRLTWVGFGKRRRLLQLPSFTMHKNRLNEYQVGELMPNVENLKKGVSTQYRSGEEAARNGKKGGIASGKSRRRKKNLKQAMQAALDMDVNSAGVKKMIASMGMDPEDATNYEALIASLLYRAVVKHDVNAIQQVMIYTGDDPDEKRRAAEEKRRKADARRKQEVHEHKKSQIEKSETEDDGFLDALNGSAADDWRGGDDG